MKIKQIVFNWVNTNDDYGSIAVECFGHHASIFQMLDSHKWSCVVDGSGKDGVESEQAAKDCAEAEIKQKIWKRIDRAKRDLEMLTDWVA